MPKEIEIEKVNDDKTLRELIAEAEDSDQLELIKTQYRKALSSVAKANLNLHSR